jgi:hypothetical protein
MFETLFKYPRVCSIQTQRPESRSCLATSDAGRARSC